MRRVLNMRRHATPGIHHQHGAILIVALLILLVMTIIGISAMRTTTLDERIAANAQYKATTFQAAESALAAASRFDAIERCLAADCVPCETDPGKPFIGTEVVATSDLNLAAGEGPVTASASMCEFGELPLTGSSIGVGGGAVVVLRAFDIRAESKFEGTNAESVHNQRVGRVAPQSGR